MLFSFFISWCPSEYLTETWAIWAASEVAGTVVLLCASWVISDTDGEWAVTGEEFAQWLPVLWVYYTDCWLLHPCVKGALINPAVKVLLHLLNLAHYKKCKQLSQSTLCILISALMTLIVRLTWLHLIFYCKCTIPTFCSIFVFTTQIGVSQ